MELSAEIDSLYGVPLDEFVSRRDALAKRLRADGEREAAGQVKALRKPTAGAWALNQAVRRRRRETDELLAAGERLRAAHEAIVSGGDRDALREAVQRERELAAALADCAEAIASETGKSGPALRERVRATLHAASVDEQAREELTRGRFVREHEAVGLGPFGASVEAVAAPSRAPKRKPAARQERTRERSAARERAEREREAKRERAARIAEATRLVEEARAAHKEARAAERAAAKLARDRERELAKRVRALERLRERKR